MFHFLPIAIRYDGSAPAGGHGYQVHIGPMYSDSRGTVKMTSADAVRQARAAVQLPVHADRPARSGPRRSRSRGSILNQPAFDEFNAGELSPGPSVATEEEVLEWVARDAETALHPSCTCAMGTGPLAVTDPASLRVHGVSGLRVVDASAMPYVTNGNIYAPGDDDRGEGGRPDHGRTRRWPRSRFRFTAINRARASSSRPLGGRSAHMWNQCGDGRECLDSRRGISASSCPNQ